MPHQSVLAALGFVETVLWFLVGILIGIVLPVAVKTLKKKAGLEAIESPLTFGQRISVAWQQSGGNKYLMLLVAATVVAVILVFILGLQFYTPRDATLAGIGWESLVNKLSSEAQSQIAAVASASTK